MQINLSGQIWDTQISADGNVARKSEALPRTVLRVTRREETDLSRLGHSVPRGSVSRDRRQRRRRGVTSQRRRRRRCCCRKWPPRTLVAASWKGAAGLRMDRRPTVSSIKSSIVRCQWTGEGQGLIILFSFRADFRSKRSHTAIHNIIFLHFC